MNSDYLITFTCDDYHVQKITYHNTVRDVAFMFAQLCCAQPNGCNHPDCGADITASVEEK